MVSYVLWDPGIPRKHSFLRVTVIQKFIAGFHLEVISRGMGQKRHMLTQGAMTFGVTQLFFKKHKHLGVSDVCTPGKVLIRRLLL